MQLWHLGTGFGADHVWKLMMNLQSETEGFTHSLVKTTYAAPNISKLSLRMGEATGLDTRGGTTCEETILDHLA